MSRRNRPLEPIGLRWALPVVFLIPVLDPTAPFALGDRYGLVILEMFASMAACALLLTALGRPMRETLWAWGVLGLFLQGYYVKSFRAAWKLHGQGEGLASRELSWVSIYTIEDGLYYITIAFVITCLTIWALLTVARPTPPLPEPAPDESRHSGWLLWASTPLALAAGMVQASLGIGLMGSEAVTLPFRLDSPLIHLRVTFAPALILLAIWLDDRPDGGRRLLLPALVSLGLLGLLNSLITTSRGSLVKLGLPVLFLWLLTNRLTRRRLGLLVALALGTLLLHPIVTAMRIARLGGSQGFVHTATDALKAVVSDDGLDIQQSGSSVSDRVSGVEGVWFMQSDLPPGLDLGLLAQLLREPLYIYYSRQIVGVQSAADFRVPGFVGFAMLVGGVAGIALLVPAILGLFAVAWRLASRLHSAPVAMSILLFGLLNEVMEGTFRVLNLLPLLASVAATELIYRRYRSRTEGRAAESPGVALRRRPPALRSLV